jgi:hypothetical protein
MLEGFLQSFLLANACLAVISVVSADLAATSLLHILFFHVLFVMHNLLYNFLHQVFFDFQD